MRYFRTNVADLWSPPDAARWALDGVTVWYIAWDRFVPNALLPNGKVPCLTAGCDGVTAITWCGISKHTKVEPGEMRSILRMDDMYDYVCGVIRRFQTSEVCRWDFESPLR